MKNYKKGSALVVLLIIIAVVAIGGGAYYYSQKSQPIEGTSPVNTSTTSVDTANWKTYISKYGFSFDYPTDIFAAPIESSVADRGQSQAYTIMLPYKSSPYDAKGSVNAENPSIKVGQVVKLGLGIHIDKQNNPKANYASQINSIAKNPSYKQVIIGGTVGYSPKDVEEYNTGPNVQYVSLNNDYLIIYMGMTVGRKIEGGVAVDYDWNPVADSDNVNLFNKILSTVNIQK